MKHRAEWTKAVEQRIAKGTPTGFGRREPPTGPSSSESPVGRVPKYGNRKGNGYDSLKEGHRHAQLALLERAGSISELRRQVKYQLIPAQYIDGECVERAVTYTADWVYRGEDGRIVVEDSKGVKTQQYILRRKLMLWVHDIRIKES